MSSCCNTPESEQKPTRVSLDYLLWGSLLATIIFYGLHLSEQLNPLGKLAVLSSSVFESVNRRAIGAPVWDQVAEHIRQHKKITIDGVNTPKLSGVDNNLGRIKSNAG